MAQKGTLILWLIDMVGEACLPSNAYFAWMPDYSPFTLGPYLPDWLNIPNFVIIDFMIFLNTILYVDLRLIKMLVTTMITPYFPGLHWCSLVSTVAETAIQNRFSESLEAVQVVWKRQKTLIKMKLI